MTYLIKLSMITLKNIGRDAIRNIIIILFVMGAVFLMNLSLATFRYCSYLNHLIESSGLYGSYMYVGAPSKQVYYENADEDMFSKASEYVRCELDQAKTDGDVADYFNICEMNSSLPEHMDIRSDFFFAKYDFLKALTFPVTKGEWFDTYSSSQEDEGLIPIVIGYNLKSYYSVGQIVALDGFDMKCIVIGILKRNALFINPNASGSGIDLNMITQTANDLIIVAREYDDMNASLIIRLPDRNRDASERAVLERIADVTDTFAFRYLADKAYQDNIYTTEMQTTLAMLALLICIVGIGCGNLLSFVRGKRRQAVYFLCGMDPQTGAFSVALEALLKLYIPALAGLCMFFVYCRREEYDGLYVDLGNVLITGLIITIIFAATLIRTLLIAKHNTSLNVLHS